MKKSASNTGKYTNSMHGPNKQNDEMILGARWSSKRFLPECNGKGQTGSIRQMVKRDRGEV